MISTLKQIIKEEARRLGFVLAGVTTPDPPPHLSVFEDWLTLGRNASMDYMSGDRSRACRADPRLILPECKSILEWLRQDSVVKRYAQAHPEVFTLLDKWCLVSQNFQKVNQ